jgi:hypothetical protein
LLKIKDMIHTGIIMNLISVLLLWGFVYFLLGTIMGLDLTVFPG